MAVFRLHRRLRLPSGMRLVHLILGAWTGLILVFLYIPILVLVVSSFNDAPPRDASRDQRLLENLPAVTTLADPVPRRQWLNNEWSGATFKWYQVLWYGSLRELRAAVGEGERFWQRGSRRLLDWLGADVARERLAKIDARVRDSVGPIINAMFNSLLIAAVATVAATTLGTTAAWLLYRFRYPLSRAINTLVAVPMIVPEIILGISLLILFATINFSTGFATVILSHITFCFPYVMITVQARLAGLDPALEEAALDLGATPLVAFWKVIVPYLFPAIISGALMAFTLSMDDFVVTFFTYSARAETFPIRVYSSVRYPNPLIMSVSTLLIVATAVLVIGSEILKKRSAV
ncbi:MAG: ABC transporter permease [Phycisphaerae bacterium]|nr:ABC transporter permease [Phycisphaerae bacterium]MDW8261435.1 ABC transporter permease [Phycisphaerales bacterium]